MTAEWVVNNKGIIEESLANQNDMVKKRLGKTEAARFENTQAEIARLSVKYNQDTKNKSEIKNQLEALREQQSSMLQELAFEKSASSANWVNLQKIQQKIPQGSVLIEFAKTRKSFYTKKRKGKKSGGRYVAWVIQNDDVSFLDLGDSDAIENEISLIRKQIEADYKDSIKLAKTAEGFDEADRTRKLSLEMQKLAGKILWPILKATCLLYTSPSPRDQRGSRMPSSA